MQYSRSSTQATTPTASELQLGQYIPLHYHYVMLQDKLRVEGFQEAIRQRVHVGMRVLELGGGTGVLSYFAARRGGMVTCVERNPVLAEQASQFLADNGVASRVKVVTADASYFVPDEPVDLVICEMLHVAMLREKQLDVIAAFKDNYRAKFGSSTPLPGFMPESSVLMVQAVEQDYDFAGYHAPVPLFQALDCNHEETTRSLSELSPYAIAAYDEAFPMRFDVDMQLEVQTPGTINALRFITQNALAVDLDDQSATCWPNQGLVLPAKPMQVAEGDRINIQFNYCSGDSIECLASSLSAEALRSRSGFQFSQRRAA